MALSWEKDQREELTYTRMVACKHCDCLFSYALVKYKQINNRLFFVHYFHSLLVCGFIH